LIERDSGDGCRYVHAQQVNVAVVGLGVGGEDLAGRLAEAALVGIERELVGGDCPFWACVPSKMMIRADGPLLAEAHPIPGMAGTADLRPDCRPVAQCIRDEATDNWHDQVAVDRFVGKGERFVRGSARLVGPRRVHVGDEVLEARRGVVIATGATPSAPQVDGLAETPYWTNRQAVSATKPPTSLLVLGGGGAVGAGLARLRPLRQQDHRRRCRPATPPNRRAGSCVLHYADQHHPRLILVECTTELASWGPATPGQPKVGDGSTYRWWLKQFTNLGYRHRVLYLNSMFFGVPQSRDRLYITATSLPLPGVRPRPLAWCPSCDEINHAVQAWKQPQRRRIGKYRQQYVYRCPSTGCRHAIVEPFVRPAAVAIDWRDLGERIGDRAKPLAPATMRRIRAGIEQFAAPTMIATNHDDRDQRCYPANGAPMPPAPPRSATAWPARGSCSTGAATTTGTPVASSPSTSRSARSPPTGARTPCSARR
jgi:Pyridine nucleotide-disulphide oxidoreductase/C-5 cytosine-specific DNA methylase